MDYKKEIDFSSLDEYIGCPRKFMFKYVFHFKSSRKNLDLVFGSCWHFGLEHAYNHMKATGLNNPKLLAALSRLAFDGLWAVEGEPHFNAEVSYPKSPARAADMYKEYWNRYAEMDNESEILGVEIPFHIHLPHGMIYLGRLDLVTMDDGILNVTDHKTAKFVNDTTLNTYYCSCQTDGYLAAGNIYYDKIPRVTYSISLCQKTKIDFHRHLISKRKTAINRFLVELENWLAKIHSDLDCLDYEKTHLGKNKTSVLECFPRNTGYSCTKYFRKCEYFDICQYRNNPLTYLDRVPLGYEVNEWHPNKHDDKMKHVLETLNG